MKIPEDPVMLLSFVNMKLRDEFENLEEMTLYYKVGLDEITKKLASINYFYDKQTNQFK